MILLVEDNDDDVFLMQRAVVKAKLTTPMQIATDGQQALDYLGGIGQYRDRLAHPIPEVVFLDLKLPYVHGFDVLRWIREQPELKQLTVFILTSSPEERDRERAKELGARGYLVKPPTAESVLQAWRSLSAPTPAIQANA
jgi:CheY-like chemotaxis protein